MARRRGNQQPAAVSFAAPPATISERREKLLRAFAQFDLNGDGVITFDEFLVCMAVLVNALYFKGEWTAPFKRDMTRPAPFK